MSKQKKREDLEQYDYIDDEWIGEASPDYIEAIGLFLIQFSSLEHAVNTSVADQINDRAHEPGYQVVELLSTRSKIDLLDRMVSLMLACIDASKLTTFKRLTKKLREINSFRNKLIHANWMSLSKDGTVRTRITINNEEGYVQFERTEISPDIIHTKIKEMENLEEELDEFLDTASIPPPMKESKPDTKKSG